MSFSYGTGCEYDGCLIMRLTWNSCSKPSFLYWSTSPSITVYLLGLSSNTQWAAVITHCGVISDPPHRWLLFSFSHACHGHSPRVASCPLTTREAKLKLRPQLTNKKVKGIFTVFCGLYFGSGLCIEKYRLFLKTTELRSLRCKQFSNTLIGAIPGSSSVP